MYHIYVKNENHEIKLYGCSDYTNEEYSYLTNYWNSLYPDHYIKSVE